MSKILDKDKDYHETLEKVQLQLKRNKLKPNGSLMTFLTEEAKKGKDVRELLNMFGIKVIRANTNLAKEILKLAKTVMVDETDDLERDIRNAIKNGDTVEFLYTKKDGSQKKREIVPSVLAKVKGRWVVKGAEVNDRRQIQKMFYLDMIGDLEGEEDHEADLAAEETGPIEGEWSGQFRVIEDDGLVKSASALKKKTGGYWQSQVQADGALRKLKSEGSSIYMFGDVARDWRGAAALVHTPLSAPNAKGFQSATGYIFDEKGVVAEYFLWVKSFTSGGGYGGGGESRDDVRLMDIYDDFGGKKRNMDQDTLDEVRQLERSTRRSRPRPPRTTTKSGGKKKWERR